jgi:hypothetical protein
MKNFLMKVPPFEYFYKFGIHVTKTIRRKRNFPRLLGASLKLAKRDPVLAAALHEKSLVFVFLLSTHNKAEILNVFTCIMVNKNMLQSLPPHRAMMIVFGELTCQLLCSILIKREQQNTV